MVATAPRMEARFEVPEPAELDALVTEDDTPVDNLPSEKQQRLLTEPLYSSWAGPPPREPGQVRPFIAAANVGLFSSAKEPPIVPDMFLSLDVRIHENWWEKRHRSYFFWEFGKPPELAIEIVSNREGGELGDKRRRYARMRVEHYVVYDPAQLLGKATLRVFKLRGNSYVLADPWFEDLGLGLVEQDGAFEGMPDRWLRWSTRDGLVIPTGAERAERERRRADSERKRADGERKRADGERKRAENEQKRAEQAEVRASRLAARLRALGIDVNGDG